MLKGLVVAVALCSAVGCGESEVLWNCTCDLMCDAGESMAEFQGCGTTEDADGAVSEGVAVCQEELAPICEQYSCACTCEPTEKACASEN